jgi:hypothetical protein
MRLATKLRTRGFTALADLLEALQATPSSARVVLTQELLQNLRAEDSKTLTRVLAWCSARGVNVVEVPVGTVLAPSDLLGTRE